MRPLKITSLIWKELATTLGQPGEMNVSYRITNCDHGTELHL